MMKLISQQREVNQDEEIERWLTIDTLVAIRLALKADDTQIFNYLVKLIESDKDTPPQSIYQNILDSIVTELMKNGFVDLVDRSADEI